MDVSIIEEPTYEGVEKLFQKVRKFKPQFCVGIGGGSLLDYTKGVAILFKNKPPAISYRGMDRVTRPGIPCILVPSLAGSGAEVTPTASFTDSYSKIKLGINGKYVSAASVFYDPRIYHRAPAGLKRKGIWDSLVHLTEAVTSKSANLLSKNLALDALMDLTQAAVAKEESILRSIMNLRGSAKAAFAMMAAGGGITSGLSYPLGIYMKIPHAEAGGRILPNLIRAHIRKKYFAGYAFLSQAFGKFTHATEKEKAKIYLRNIEKHFYKYKTKDTKKITIKNSKMLFLVKCLFMTRKHNLQSDPVVFSKKEIINILKNSL